MSDSQSKWSPPTGDWDDDRAQGMIGMRVLIGITRVRSDGHQQEQMFGVIVSADKSEGFEVTLQGKRLGEAYMLPPDLSAFKDAQPGHYSLRSTGETVIDPDLLATWTISPPGSQS
jgi:hypothetical protein